MRGPFGLFVVRPERNWNWFGRLDHFVYWYDACVDVLAASTNAPILFIRVWVNVADYYEFQGTPKIERGAFQYRINDDEDGGDKILLNDSSVKHWAYNLMTTFPEVLKSRLMIRDEWVLPPWITTRRFLNLHRIGTAAEFGSIGSSPATALAFRAVPVAVGGK